MDRFDEGQEMGLVAVSRDGDATAQAEDVAEASVWSTNSKGVWVPWSHPFVPVLAMYLALRLALFFCNVLAAIITNVNSWTGPFTAWDGHWYVQVAQSWYGSTALAPEHLTYAAGGFEPGWPAFIKLGTLARLSFPDSAFVMSIILGGATFYAVWHLSRELLPEHPQMATAAVMAFPGAAVAFGMAYSEVLSIGCVAATLVFLIRKRWLLAGVVAGVATATSSLAIVVVLACLVEACIAIARRREFRSIYAVAIAPAGFLSFVGYLGFLSRDPFYWWKLQGQAWGAKIEPAYLFQWATSFKGTGWGVYWMALSGLIMAIRVQVGSAVVRESMKGSGTLP